DADPEYWDDVPHEDSSFVHRVAVRRKYAGKGLARKMIEWAKNRARDEGKRFLRLDCADRPKLREVYEKMGFIFHSVKRRSPYNVIRYEFDLNKLD
ncbi:MAG: GNAT family N-acetyltransferase, partial [Acidobacteriota bacterium]|nr:GNAT family N-acetyltransferase [Acidobacteriota bacterium]